MGHITHLMQEVLPIVWASRASCCRPNHITRSIAGSNMGCRFKHHSCDLTRVRIKMCLQAIDIVIVEYECGIGMISQYPTFDRRGTNEPIIKGKERMLAWNTNITPPRVSPCNFYGSRCHVRSVFTKLH